MSLDPSQNPSQCLSGEAFQPDPVLLEAARVAYAQAYAPFSRFQVGAAIRAENGQVYFGANVENSSYGLTRCGEQSAVQAMASAGGRTFSELVVYTHASPPATPCGACRQILFEFSPGARFTSTNPQGEMLQGRVADLLPHGFRLNPEE